MPLRPSFNCCWTCDPAVRSGPNDLSAACRRRTRRSRRSRAPACAGSYGDLGGTPDPRSRRQEGARRLRQGAKNTEALRAERGQDERGQDERDVASDAVGAELAALLQRWTAVNDAAADADQAIDDRRVYDPYAAAHAMTTRGRALTSRPFCCRSPPAPGCRVRLEGDAVRVTALACRRVGALDEADAARHRSSHADGLRLAGRSEVFDLLLGGRAAPACPQWPVARPRAGSPRKSGTVLQHRVDHVPPM
ncbi:hypothetical protein [Spirillospora sp. CA-128828]|uniref:hypothetical protein n=1 Tax=Spirillospora sp. CA-128828 TaxID=3240033 RepID=UPI003D8FE7D2